MLRCTSCNGILTKSESVCYSCGEKTGLSEKPKGGGFNTVAATMFYIALGMTGISLFTSFGPPLSVCLPAVIILLFVKSSADQLKKNQT
jgi:hypothetical protein